MCVYTYTHIYTSISVLFQILFPYRLLQDTEHSSLCYTVGPCWLFILYIVVCICSSQTPNLPLPTRFSFLKNCQTLFESDCTISHSPQQCMRTQICPQVHQHNNNRQGLLPVFRFQPP